LNCRLSRYERVSGRTTVKKLFASKSSFFEYPFRVRLIGRDLPAESPARILISIPKHHVRRAVDRNLLKRRIREAYRLQKQGLCDSLKLSNRNIDISFSYCIKEILPFARLQEKIILILHRLTKENEKLTG
jgi:ribonuclease P protein component